jgi:hypothetical protein
MLNWGGGRARAVHAIDGDYLNFQVTGSAGDPDIFWMASHAGTINAGAASGTW